MDSFKILMRYANKDDLNVRYLNRLQLLSDAADKFGLNNDNRWWDL